MTEQERPRYMISVAAELVGMHPQTLRIYESKGLVRPRRTPGNTRLYSEADLERLRLIQRLTTELGLNLAGVETVIRLEDELGKARARLDRLERELRREIRNVHKQYKREVVLYRREDRPPRKDEMDFNRLTIKSGEAVAAAQELARRRGNPEVYPEHLCIALLDQELPRTLVERAGESVDSLRAECEAKLAQKPAVQGSSQQPPRLDRFRAGPRPRRGRSAVDGRRVRLDRAPPARARRRLRATSSSPR